MSAPVGIRWFRHAGGMAPLSLDEPTGRYLSFAEREEIALLKAQNKGVREIARTIGRDPATITKSVNLGLAWRQGDLEAQFGNTAEFVKPGVLMGSVQEVVDRIGEYTDAGAEWVILAMRAPFDVDGLDRFAAEVLPALG